jgi:hypothetical protein
MASIDSSQCLRCPFEVSVSVHAKRALPCIWCCCTSTAMNISTCCMDCYTYVHVRVHTCKCVCVYTHTHTHTHTHDTCAQARTHSHSHTHTYTTNPITQTPQCGKQPSSHFILSRSINPRQHQNPSSRSSKPHLSLRRPVNIQRLAATQSVKPLGHAATRSQWVGAG